MFWFPLSINPKNCCFFPHYVIWDVYMKNVKKVYSFHLFIHSFIHRFYSYIYSAHSAFGIKAWWLARKFFSSLPSLLALTLVVFFAGHDLVWSSESYMYTIMQQCVLGCLEVFFSPILFVWCIFLWLMSIMVMSPISQKSCCE